MVCKVLYYLGVFYSIFTSFGARKKNEPALNEDNV